MRTLLGSFACFPMAMMVLVIGCNTVSPGECWPNTSGGFGGEGPIPIGAGVGATTGDYPAAPPKGPLSNGDTPNPCVEGDEMAGANLSRFKPADFKFVTIVADDGTDKGGGWQEAKAGLILGPTPYGGAVCGLRIGMPLRSYAWGNVPPKIAAIYTANVVNTAADNLEKSGSFELPPGILCDKLKTEVETLFPKMYVDMGAKVNKWTP